MRLGELSAGQTARVLAFLDMDPAIRKKLLALGLLPNRQVQFVRRAPLGDPIQLRIGSSQFSIRQALAEKIHVELVV
ncbi:FeoA family protein [Bacterioplanoides pacificum]|uniref:Ferrous iron transport protein A n=1 Tax=Bacterioplanoides pacificum TaxID=1171596 RepID=A0ABV7VY40_9GAMM